MALGPGTRLGAYEVISLLGKGGMGEVYLARDLKLGREVAIKILPEKFASDPSRLRRFEHEARAASSLNHPNIITIYDIDREGSTHYMAMEYVAGRTLRSLVELEPLPLDKLLGFAAQMTEALAKAHAAGIVHRDLKPENVMVTEDGYVKILDFGLAKAVPVTSEAGSTVATQTVTGEGVVVGTAGYMSPEQARGSQADFRSDQFSCGAILYEMATGKRAFQRDSAVQTLAAIIEDDPEPVSLANPLVPEPLGWVLERCMAKDPSARYDSTLDLAREVRNLRDQFSGASASARALPRPRKRLSRAALGAVALILLLAVLAVAWFATRGPAPRDQAADVSEGPHYLAIATFRNLAGDREGEFFSEGLTEAIMSRLMDLEGVHVVPATTDIGAGLVLEGGVQRAGEHLRITYRLTRRKENTALGGGVVDGQISEIFSLQDRVATEVTRKLEAGLGRASLSAEPASGPRPTEDVTAYSFYLQGRGYLRRYKEPANTDIAISLLEKATDRDPRFALAQAGLGEAYWRKYQETRAAAWIDRALTACNRALELNQDLTEAHTALGTLYRGTGRHEEAIEAFSRAITLDLRNDDAYRGLAAVYAAEDQLEQAERTYRRAIEIRPDYWAGYSWLGAFYFSRGRYEEAAEQFRRVIELTPDNYVGYSSLGGIYHLMGRFADAEPLLQKSVAIKPTSAGYTNLGTFYFYQGRYADAVPMMERAVELESNDYMLMGNLADTYRSAKGYEDRAPGAYRRAIELAREELKVNPKAARIRGSLSVYHARLGEKKASTEEIASALKLTPSDANLLFDALLVHELAGDRERALDALDKALKAGYSIEEIRREPDLEALRRDPRYRNLVSDR